MSYQALNWAVKQRIGTPVGKGIVMALANYADEKGTCFPSHERLARETELSDKSVRTHLKRLEDLGVLTTERKRDDAGRLGLIRYCLALDRSFDIAADDTKGSRKEKKLPPDVAVNGEATVDESQHEGAPVAQRQGAPLDQPASGAENPAASEGASNLSKITTDSLSLPSQPSGTDEAREKAISDELEAERLFTELATLWPMKDKLAEARAFWDVMAPGDRRAAFDHAPSFLAGLKGKRSFIEALVNFLKGAAWRFTAHAGTELSSSEIKAFSRKFWAWVWLSEVPTRDLIFALSEAHRGKSLWLRPSKEPSDEVALSLVAVEVTSTAFAAWQAEMAKRGVTLQRPDKAAVIWVPSEYPTMIFGQGKQEPGAAA